jgi:DNA excision repair protein ERCC-4
MTTATARSLIPVLIDTREQRPWEFDCETFTTDRATLRAGDYSIAGLEDRVVLERKSLGDFVNTVIQDWIRFRKELYRLAGYDHAAVVVEANIEDVFQHKYESDAKPVSVIGRIHGIYLDHGIPVYFWGPRPACIAMVERFLVLTAKKLGGEP